MALIPQKTINAYSHSERGEAYEAGDFVVRFDGCTKTGETSCQQEAMRYGQWREAFAAAA